MRAARAVAILSLSLLQLGQWADAESSIQAALALVPASTEAPTDVWSSRAQVLSIQGRLYFSQGNNSKAAEVWAQAANGYGQAGQPREQAHAQVSQARALQAAGFYERALAQVQAALIVKPADQITVDALVTYGDLLRLTGQTSQAQETLTEALTLAETLELPGAISSIYNSLGVLAEAESVEVKAARSLAWPKPKAPGSEMLDACRSVLTSSERASSRRLSGRPRIASARPLDCVMRMP